MEERPSAPIVEYFAELTDPRVERTENQHAAALQSRGMRPLQQRK